MLHFAAKVCPFFLLVLQTHTGDCTAAEREKGMKETRTLHFGEENSQEQNDKKKITE